MIRRLRLPLSVSFVLLALLASAKYASATNYYINCAAGSNGSGTQASPWNSLASPNAHTFAPGDYIYFNRGTTCYGLFYPLGSGNASAPITVTAYGTGALPTIDGQSNWAVFNLSDQSYWSIENLQLLHGKTYGLYVYSCNDTAVTNIYIANISATDATYVMQYVEDSGEIYMATCKPGANGEWDGSTINNVYINGITTGNTTVSEGIFIRGGDDVAAVNGGYKGNNIWVGNSTVSNVHGNGILIVDAQNSGESANVVSLTGQCTTNCGSQNPGSVWVWNSTNMTMEWNESYSNSSWGAYDGGGMDIDTYNTNVTAEYNYLHDNQGYCICVLGTGGVTTTNSIIRFNVCVNNNNVAVNPSGVQVGLQGDFYLSVWDGGLLNGVQIYNNTSYYDSTMAHNAEFQDFVPASSFGTSIPSFYKNNLVYSNLQYPGMVNAWTPFTLSNNLYFTSAGAPTYYFGWNGTWWDSFDTYQTESGQDAYSMVVNPLLGDPGYDGGATPTNQYEPQSGSPAIGAGVNVCAGISGCSMGSNDFLGKPLPSTLWIGAIQE